MDIVNLAGIHKYNALTIFQRVVICLLEDSSENIGGIEETGSVPDNNRTAAESWSGEGKGKG